MFTSTLVSPAHLIYLLGGKYSKSVPLLATATRISLFAYVLWCSNALLCTLARLVAELTVGVEFAMPMYASVGLTADGILCAD